MISTISYSMSCVNQLFPRPSSYPFSPHPSKDDSFVAENSWVQTFDFCARFPSCSCSCPRRGGHNNLCRSCKEAPIQPIQELRNKHKSRIDTGCFHWAHRGFPLHKNQTVRDRQRCQRRWQNELQNRSRH